MKKFLSLVLALVMTMSLVTVSAGAKDFTDDSSITYEEAVDVMSAVGVIDGYTDGSFQPTTNLTRGAAAKIICNLILGPTTAAALGADTAPYSDVPTTNTFAGYIAYCQKEGIISGYADGTFRPSAPLTGYAFMKMLLGALGYDSTKEGYTGANWSVNVAKQALAIGLDDGNDEFVGQASVNREEAMLYAFNTMKATMVTYGNDTTIVVGDVSISTSGQASKVANGADKETIYNDDEMQFAEEYFPNLTLSSTVSTDDFGRPANVWKVKSETVGTYAKEADFSYTEKVKGSAIYSDLDTGAIDDDDVTYYVDGVEKDLPAAFHVTKSNDEKIGGQGTLTQVFYNADNDNDTDDIVITVINTYLAQVSGDYDEDDEELDIVLADNSATPESGDTSWTLSSDDFAGLDEFEDEDYVLITVASDNGEDNGQYVATIAAAEKVTATVTSYTSDSSVTADGTKYSYNATCNAADDAESYEYVIKEDYDLYLDSYGNVIFAEGVDVEGNYLYLVDAAQSGYLSTSKVVAGVYFLDGTYAEITLNKVDGDKADKDETAGWYTYTTKSDDTYNLESVDKVSELDTGSDGDELIDGIYVGTIRANASTQFVIVDEKGENGDAYTGIKNAPDVKTSVGGDNETEGWAVMDGNYAKYVYIYVGDGKTTGSAASSDIIYILDTDWDKSVDEDENIYYTYTALVNGEEKDVNVSEDCDNAATLETGLYTSVAYDDNDYVTDLEPVEADEANFLDCEEYTVEYYSAAAEITQSGSVVTFADLGETAAKGDGYYMADGAKIIVIDGDEAKTVTAKKLASDYDNMFMKVYGVLKDGEFTTLYVVLGEVGADTKDEYDVYNVANKVRAIDTDLEDTYESDTAAKTAVEGLVDALLGESGVTKEVTISDFQDDVACSSEEDAGTPGSFTAEIVLTKNDAEETVSLDFTFAAEAYVG